MLGVAGCTGGGDPEPARSDATAPTSPTPTPTLKDAGADSVRRTVVVNDQTIDLEVGPVRVRDGVGLLEIGAVETNPGDGKWGVSLDILLTNPNDSAHSGPSAVRLVDPVAGTVSDVAEDAEHRVNSSELTRLDDGPVRLYAAFAAPTGDMIDVLLPGIGYVADVPVLASHDDDGADVILADLTETPAAELTLPVVTLDSFTEEVAGAVQTRVAAEEVTVAIAADVLFAADSADLGGEADAALTAAGGQIAQYDAGTLTVVGHTDDVADDAYNQDLSVRRAQAVADRLAGLVDLSSYPAAVEGRGESEPIASGTSTGARAANRRVELRFTPAADAEPAELAPAPTGELPAADGPVGTGAAGVQVQREVGGEIEEFTVALPQVRRVGDMLVGELTVERVSGGRGLLMDLFSNGHGDSRGDSDTDLQWAANNLTLLVGATRYHALDYVLGDLGNRDPLVDKYLQVQIEDGGSLTVTVVWPVVPGETVTLDAPSHAEEDGIQVGGAAFRLTDIPVVEQER